MPITVTSPTQGAWVGPGVHLRAETTLDPIPVGAYWQVIARDVQSQQVLGFSRVAGHNPVLDVPMSVIIEETGTVRPNFVELNGNALSSGEHELLYTLNQATGISIEVSTPVGVIWRPDPAGIAYVQSLAPAAQGGFTPADRTTLADTKALASFPLGAFLPGLPGALAGALPTPYGRELITPDRTGGGVLTRPGGIFNVNALGIAFEILAKPVGIGVDEGAPPSYELPLLELGLTRQLRDNDVTISDSAWYSDQEGTWIWNFNAPFQVLYWLQPGVTARFWWLLLQPIGAQLVGPREILTPTDGA